MAYNSAQSPGPFPSSRKSRRSWFDAPPLTTLNCPGDGSKQTRRPAPKKRSLDSVENLTLTHFTAPPRIAFGNVVLGRTKIRTLLVRNPHDYEQEVIVERFPYKKKFMIKTSRFTVEPNQVFSLEISWEPDEAGGVREMIQFYINDVYRLQAFLFGTAEQPKQLKRQKRKNGLGPKVRQPPSVLQTTALANIKSSYSPRRSEEALGRLEEADMMKRENDKENSGPSKVAEAPVGVYQKGSGRNDQEHIRSGAEEETLHKKLVYSENKAVSTPTPLESTTIMAKQEKEVQYSGPRSRKQWKGISGGTSTILNTMSPIPLNEGNEHGMTVDSYYQPNDSSVTVYRQANLNFSHVMQETDRLSETFAKPLLPANAVNPVKNKYPDRRSTTTLPSSAFTSCVGKLLHPDLTQIGVGFPQGEETYKLDKTSAPCCAIDNSTSMAVLKAPNVTEVINSSVRSPKAAVLSPRTPSIQRQTDGVFSQASPNTMLNESLSLISNMKMPHLNNSPAAVIGGGDESGSSSPNEMNTSLISQGLGMVSPESFMEDMRNASMNFSHRDCLEVNSTSTPNLPESAVTASEYKTVNGAASGSISRTPNKSRPTSSRFGSKRRSFTSQFQKEQVKRVTAAVKAVKSDREGLASITGSPYKARYQNSIKSGKSKRGQEVSGTAVAKVKELHSKQSNDARKLGAKKRSPACGKSPMKRLRKEAIMKQMKAKSKEKKLIYQDNAMSATVSENLATPDSKSNHYNANTVLKSRSFEQNTVTKSKQDDSISQSRYFPDIFTNEHNDLDGNTSNNASRQTRRQLCPGNKYQNSSKAPQNANPDSTVDDVKCQRQDLEACCQRKYDRAVAVLERIPSSPLASPNKFEPMSPANFPTSPSGLALDYNRRATLTVTKSRPSDALLAAMNNRKQLFGQKLEPLDSENCRLDGADNSEMHENIEVVVKESYEEREGTVYVVVKEITSVTKSTTDTFVEQVSVEGSGVSPGNFNTPTRLPSSPDPQLSRRSTQVIHSPKIIDKTGMRAKILEFESELNTSDEKTKSLKDLTCESDVLSKTKSDTFEKESSVFVDPGHQSCPETKETSAALESTSRSDTFEKETSKVLEWAGDKTAAMPFDKQVLKLNTEHPITAVCTMSPRLVDYDEIVSEDGGSAGNLTKDSLDITSLSEDSLDKGKAPQVASQGEHLNQNEKSGKDWVTKQDSKEIRMAPVAFIPPADDHKNLSAEGKEGKETESAESEEEDQFYDTLSQRYYDALSDTLDADLQEVCLGEDKVDKCGNQEVEDGKSLKDMSTTPISMPQNDPSKFSHECNMAAYIDRKENRLVHHRQALEIKSKEEEDAKRAVISTQQDQRCKGKKKLRRSLSADQLNQPLSFSVDVSDLKKSSKTKEYKKSEIGVNMQVKGRENFQRQRQEISAKPANQRKISGARSTEMSHSKPRSQSLSNIQKMKDNKATQNEERTRTKTTVKCTSGVTYKGVPQSKLILLKKPKSGAPRHPMPFAARNMYYDERWMEKQERGFVQWLNFVLTPPDEYMATTSKAKVNAGSLSLDSHQGTSQLAPTKEVLSFRAYAARRRLNRLRRQACQLYQSDRVVFVIRKVEVEVESRRIAMRKDKMAHADLGIKQRIMDLLLQYSSLWLRVGLETIFGEILMLQSNQDVWGLSRFIVTRLLSSPDIAAEHAHPTVPHLFREGYAAAVSRHTVKKFLLLVFFLDYAKTSRLIEHDPCLFCKDAEIKSSKEILVQFSREVLSGEGDITRHLAYMGYTVSQCQRPIDEFDFAVKSLSSDLRDGLRLSRVMEFMAEEQGIMGRLRTPAISRLQKVHNMEEFFKAAQKHGLDLSSSGVSARDIVDGHREKTLILLWRIILYFQSCIQVNESALREEINLLTKSLQLKLAMQKVGTISIAAGKASRDSGAGDSQLLTDGNVRLQLIFQWCRLVCLHYGVKVENFTVSFSDGRALCCLLHHYHPALLPLELVKFETSVALQEAAEQRQEQKKTGEDEADASMDWAKSGEGLFPGENDPGVFEKLLANEKWNFKTLYEKVSALGGVPLMLKSADMSNTIPDEKVVSTYVSYLCVRLLDIREEVRAARLIQMAWRRRLLRRAVKKRQEQEQIRRQQEGKATLVLQKFWRARRAKQQCERLRLEKEMKQLEVQQASAAVTLQKFWRARLARQYCERLRLEKEAERIELEVIMAAKVLQRFVRGWQCRRDLSRRRWAAVCLQMAWKRRQARNLVTRLRHEREARAATLLERHVRGFLCRKRLMRMKSACLVFQKNWRRVQARKELERLKCERTHKLARMKLEKETQAATLIQAAIQRFLFRKNFLKHKDACILIQSSIRRTLAMRHLSALRAQRDEKAALIITKQIKAFISRRKFHALKQAAIIVQSFWRMYRAQKELSMLRHTRRDKSAVIIQRVMKGLHQSKKFEQLKQATLVLQRYWRSKKARLELEKLRAQHRERAAIIIQRHLRTYIARQMYLTLKCSTLILQKNWRMTMAKKVVDKMRADRRKECAVVIQKHYRGFQKRSEFCKLKRAAVTFQTNWRRIQAQRLVVKLKLQRQNRAATLIQAVWRGWCVSKYFFDKKTATVRIQSFWRMWTIRQLFLRKKSAATIILSWFRINVKAKNQRQAYLKLRQSAVYIERVWRGKRQRERFLKMKAAALVIQSNFRGYRRRLKFMALRLACIIIQRRLRAQIEGRKQLAEYKLKVQAAVCIQRYFRKIQKQKYLRRIAAALLLQTVWRKTQSEKLFKSQKASAIIIQKRFREYSLAKACREDYLTTRKAARTIQSTYRAYRIKKNYAKFLQTVIKLQACLRSKQAQQVFMKKQLAVLIIQRKHRANRLGRVFREAFLLIRDSAIKLQRFFRAIRERRKVQRELTIQRSAATQIQALYRAHRLRKSYLALKQATVSLQQRYRALKTGREERAVYEEMRCASCLLQTWWRDCLKIREVRRHEAEAERVRRLEAERLEQERRLELERQEEERRRELERLVEEKRCDRAVRILQRSWRGYLVMRDYVIRENAAVLIQTQVRGYLARLAYERTVGSVIFLQSVMKAWVYKRRFEMARLAARIIQRRWREALESRKLREEYLTLRDTAVKLQSLVRMKAQRKCFLSHIRSIICLQAHARMYIQLKKFCQLKETTVYLQHKVRAYQAMKKDRAAFLSMKDSAIKIQAAVRLWLAFKSLQRERSAVIIQSLWRMRQQRVAYIQAYEAAQVLKSFMLLKQEQQENQARHEAAITIQRAFRSFLLQQEADRYNAACLIQRWYRHVQSQLVERKNSAAISIAKTLRRIVLHKKQLKIRSAIVIQSGVRMFQERKRYLKLRRSVILLQAAVRGYQAREVATCLRVRHQAATIIKAAVRGFLVRRRVAPLLQERIQAAQEHRVHQLASTRIQAWWRGYLIRCTIKNKRLIQARKRLEEVNRSATEEKTLGSRTTSALDYLLKERDLAYILESLMHLETATRLSPECCQRMVEVNGVRVLYRLVSSCNRSIPHMDLIKYSISILLNLAKYTKTIHSVLEPEECLGTLLDLLQIYRDKGLIFYKACMLLGVLGLAPPMKAHILTYPGITERLQSIHSLVLRKQKAAQTRQTALDKMAAMRSSYNCTLPVLTPSKSRRRPRVQPYWSMAQDAIKEFEDPTTAIHFVLDSLQIGAKTKF